MMKETRAAIKAAKSAGELLANIYGSNLEIHIKQDGSLVTNADYSSEGIIMDTLGGAFPDYGMISEESGVVGSADKGMWVIDPLDGTYSFSRNKPMFAISIAFVKNNEIRSGVVYIPLSDEIFYAELGSGAFLNGRRINVSDNNELKSACMNITGTLMKTKVHALKKIFSSTPKIRVLGSSSYEMTYVACGRFDMSIETNIKPYDIAAATLIVREAGGKVTSFDGSNDVLNNKDIFSSNGLLHNKLLSVFMD